MQDAWTDHSQWDVTAKNNNKRLFPANNMFISLEIGIMFRS